MNYDNILEIHNYWSNNLRPHLPSRLPIQSFMDYIKKITRLPSFRWIDDLDNTKVARVSIPCDSEKFVTMFEKQCVSYYYPIHIEDRSYIRAIYQISPTFHVDAAFSVWYSEINRMVHSFPIFEVLYKDEKDLEKFMNQLMTIKLEGNTETRPTSGFGLNPFSEGLN